ncbi:MAG: ABC transporter ATP-binding protein [Rhodobacteraceae bacterium]|nr:ABC transporter ATP-binding protein [Paracoccaceae bacterium]
MGTIQLNSLEKWFGNVQVIKGVDLEMGDGEFVVFVGPSGCGKSTLLRLIGGLEEASAGKILLNGRDVTGEPPAKRGLTMVFQSYALYPHMSVGENMGFSLKMSGAPKSKVDEKVGKAARILKLEELLERRPKELSGGQRQRVAIGRSIVRDPTAFLFDEPLSNLDAALRVEMRYEIAKLHQSLKSTMIYVTHDQVEAMTLANRIVVLDQGQIAQVGSPRELYERPVNRFVAQFIGSPKMNMLACRSGGGSYRLPGGRGGPFFGDAEAVEVGVRPEHIAINETGSGQLDGVVDVVEYLGADTFVIVDCSEAGQVTVRVTGTAELVPGQAIGLTFPEDKLHFLDSSGMAVHAAPASWSA